MSYAILVNTTDSFEDCWTPFFALFSKYWPSFSGRMYLNTESKSFAYPGLDLISLENGLVGERWSDCLLAALSAIEEDDILYLQEDYFLHAPVDAAMVAQMYGLFAEWGLDCLHITGRSTRGPVNQETFSPLLWEIVPGASYRISLQPAFWRKQALGGLVKPGKKAGQFEVETNRETKTEPAKVYCISRHVGGQTRPPIFPFVCTGVMGGRWNRAVKRVFRENGIAMDYRRRGYYRPRGFVAGWTFRVKWAVKEVLYRAFGYRWRL